MRRVQGRISPRHILPQRPEGLICLVYRSAYPNDHSPGVTSQHDQVILIGGPVPEVVAPAENTPALYLHWYETVAGKRTGWFASPSPDPAKGGYTFGGNFIFTSDDRFPSEQPIPVHDRQGP